MATNTEPLTKREPARIVVALVALAGAILIALPLIGVQVDPGLPDAVENVIYAAGAVGAIVAPLVQAEITRRKVYSPATVDEVVAETKAQAQVQRIDQRRHRRTALDPDGDGIRNL